MIVIYSFVIILGLVLGSFIYTMAIRLQNQESVWKRSTCQECHHPVSIIGLIPLIGYGLSGGKCRKCGSGVSPVYPMMELMNSILVLAVFWRTGWRPEFFHMVLIFECLFLLAILDFRTYLIFPQPIVAGLLIQTGWLVLTRDQSMLDCVLGLFIGAGIFHWVSYLYELIRKKTGLGDGDAILLGLIGYAFGWGFLFSTIFWSAVFGILGGGAFLVLQRQSLRREIAFGPWLALSALVIWIFPDLFRSIPFDTTAIRIF